MLWKDKIYASVAMDKVYCSWLEINLDGLRIGTLVDVLERVDEGMILV